VSVKAIVAEQKGERTALNTKLPLSKETKTGARIFKELRTNKKQKTPEERGHHGSLEC